MKRIGNFLLENTEFLQDIKMNASYSDPDLSSILKNGDFKITVGNINLELRTRDILILTGQSSYIPTQGSGEHHHQEPGHGLGERSHDGGPVRGI